jgi:hypothetical protein
MIRCSINTGIHRHVLFGLAVWSAGIANFLKSYIPIEFSAPSRLAMFGIYNPLFGQLVSQENSST